MTGRTRILAAAGTLLVLVLVLLLVLPLLFRDRIAERVKAEVNRTVNARIDWRDVGLTFFRNFPNLTVRLDDLTAVGVGRFEGDTLAAVRHLGVVLDLGSVVRQRPGTGQPDRGALHRARPASAVAGQARGRRGQLGHHQGRRPKPAAQPEAAKPMALSLRRFEITDASVALDNRQAGLKASLAGYDQSLKGDFSQEQVAIETRASSDTVNLTFAGIPYLNRVKLDLSADVQADLTRKIFTLKQTELRLNDLALRASGSATAAGEDIGLDLAFDAPSTEFRHILSLVPAIYAHDFQSVQASGKIGVSGKVKGSYGDKAFPSFSLITKVDNGAFRYPDLPLPARDIFVDLAITNPGGDADSTVVRLQRFHVVIGRDPVDATMVLRTPMSDPNLDLRVQGKIDLADVRRTMKLEGIDELAGTVAADATVRTRMSYIDAKQYEKVDARGSVAVGNLTVKGEGLPQPLAIQEASLQLAPERAELRSFKGIGRQQRSPGLGLAGEPARLRAPGRRAPGQRHGAEQPVQPRRVAVGRRRPGGDPGAGQDRFRTRRHRRATHLRQAQDEQRPGPPAGEGPASDAGELPAEHARRRDRGQRVLRDHEPGQAHVRRRTQDDQHRHPLGVRGVHHGPDARSGREVRAGQVHHRSEDRRSAGQEHDAAVPGARRARIAPDRRRW